METSWVNKTSNLKMNSLVTLAMNIQAYRRYSPRISSTGASAKTGMVSLTPSTGYTAE
jgi:hypothetical protein